MAAIYSGTSLLRPPTDWEKVTALSGLKSYSLYCTQNVILGLSKCDRIGEVTINRGSTVVVTKVYLPTPVCLESWPISVSSEGIVSLQQFLSAVSNLLDF